MSFLSRPFAVPCGIPKTFDFLCDELSISRVCYFNSSAVIPVAPVIGAARVEVAPSGRRCRLSWLTGP